MLGWREPWLFSGEFISYCPFAIVLANNPAQDLNGITWKSDESIS